MATVVYNNPQSANYACEKLHGFEYPPGQRLIVRLDSRGDINQGPMANQALQRLNIMQGV